MALSIGDLPSEGVELDPRRCRGLGSVLSAETVADLGTLDLTKVSPPSHGGPSCWFETTGRRRRAREGSRHRARRVGVAEGQADLVDVLPDQARLPERPSPWCRMAPGQLRASPTTVTPVVARAAVVAAKRHDARRRAGGPARPLGLFGILTEPEVRRSGRRCSC